MVIKMEINDGYMPFKGFKTYYRIVDGGDKTPLICLHGGPGSTHNSFEYIIFSFTMGKRTTSYDFIYVR